MKKTGLIIFGLLAAFSLGYLAKTFNTSQTKSTIGINQTDKIYQSETKTHDMKLGAFSISLNVKNLKTSKEFYEGLGFKVFAGGMEMKYLIMKNENSLIGLFHGMFEGNLLTFNPGWDENAQNIENFEDIREIQKHLKTKDIKVTSEADETTSGPASFMLTDPDGNVILLDQHR